MRVSATAPFLAGRRCLLAVLILIAALAGPPAAAAEAAEAAGATAQETATQDTATEAPSGVASLRSLWARTTIYIRTQQRELHRELAGAIKAVRRDGAAAAWTLIVLSFLYGVFHAAGPGHGKMVISTYLLTHKSALRRGLWLSAAASLTQGLTAIVLVLVLVALIGWTRSDAQAVT